MKKYLCFIILITVLCSCSSTLEPENYSELGPSRLGNGFSWTETEKAWILADYPNDFFSYYDKAYGGVDIFCAKPDCLHDDENCGAYATRLSPALIQYYGGKIYYYAEYDHKNGKNGIFRMQPDGTKR